jgi:hypothetical protein
MATFYIHVGDRYIEPDCVESTQFPVSKVLHSDNSLTIIDPNRRALVHGQLRGVGASSTGRAAGRITIAARR